MIETTFQFLAAVLFLQSLLALIAALRFARYSLRQQTPRHHRYQPKAVVIIPCKGLEPGLEENIEAFCSQDYREYELILVTESEQDAAYRLVSKVIKQSRRSAWLVVAGEAKDRGQKVHNLLAALETLNAVDRRVEILVFADSDARPSRNWLSELIAPLDEKRVGATTGFRWYVPGYDPSHGEACGPARRLSRLLLTVWNSSALALLGERSSLAWGGATAIRRETFDQLGVRERWSGALSDDYVLTAALHEAGHRIRFVPAALMPTHTTTDLQGLLEFTTRQMRITRVYAPRVWRLAMISNLLFNLTLWGGLGSLLLALVQKREAATLGSLLASILILGAATCWVRIVVAARLLRADRRRILSQRWVQPLLVPLASALYLYNLVASAWSRRIVWRGIGYELISQTETRIWLRPEATEMTEEASPKSSRSRASARSTLP